MKSHFQILIIGGGTGGIMLASNLLRRNKTLDIAIVEPSDDHYYQPAWTLVGAGTYDFDKTRKSMADVMPKGTTWIKDFASGFDPENNSISTRSSGSITYDYLVVAPGLVMDTSLIEGLTESLDKGVVCSNYTDPNHTWKVMKNFKGGNALFTQPATPIKCGGAPQKTAYLAADYFRKNNLSQNTNVIFATPGSVIFGIPEIRATLEKVLDRYGIHFKPFYSPVKIDGENRVATFQLNITDENKDKFNIEKALSEIEIGDNRVEIPFDMLHIAPPQTPPKFVKESVLANEGGWLDVDQFSLQHKIYPNIFGLGDVAGLPTAKTGAAIRKQVPVVADNLTKMIKSNSIGDMSYNGYSSCPLVTAYGKMVLAEFDYDGNFIPDPKLKQMLIFNSAKEHWRLWMLKKYILPRLYWKKMLKGIDV